MNFPQRRLSGFSKLKNNSSNDLDTYNKKLSLNGPLTHISISEKFQNKPNKEEEKDNKENDIEIESNDLVNTVFYESVDKGIEGNISEFNLENENQGFLNWFCCRKKQLEPINNFEDNNNNDLKFISCNIF